jgi:lambda repressor-like predicted transcriptional regulator
MKRGQSILGYGVNIRAVMELKAKGLSLKQILAKTGLSYSAIYNALKRGNIDWATTFGQIGRQKYGSVKERMINEQGSDLTLRELSRKHGIPYSSVVNANGSMKLNLGQKRTK